MSYREGRQFSQAKHNFTEYAGVDFSKISDDELRALWLETLQNGMHGICFSMYEDGQKPGDIITEEQVERRIQILKPFTKWVRSFSCIEGNEHVPRIAHKNGLQTLVGAWLGDDLEANEKEIDALIQLANQGCVTIAAVGNEVLYRNELNEELLRVHEPSKDYGNLRCYPFQLLSVLGRLPYGIFLEPHATNVWAGR